MDPKQKKIILIGTGVLLLLISFGTAFFPLVRNKLDTPKNSEQQKVEPSNLSRLPRSEVTATDAVVIRKVFYVKSKVEVEEKNNLPPELVGLSREALAARLSNGIIERFSPQEIIVREVRDQLAPLHAAKKFIGIEEGRVAVFRGIPGLAFECINKTDIPVTMLPPQEVSDLHKGIPILNDKNLMEILMGLSSLAFAD